MSDPGAAPVRTPVGDKLAAVGCLVLAVSFFLTWMGGSFVYVNCDPTSTNCSVPGADKNGFDGVGLLVVLLLLATVAYLALRSSRLRNVVSVRQPAWSEGVALMGAAGALLACLVVYFFEFHAVGGGATRSPKLGFYGVVVSVLLVGGGGLLDRRAAQLDAGGRAPVATSPARDPYGASSVPIPGRGPATPGIGAAPETGAGTGTTVSWADADPYAGPTAGAGGGGSGVGGGGATTGSGGAAPTAGEAGGVAGAGGGGTGAEGDGPGAAPPGGTPAG